MKGDSPFANLIGWMQPNLDAPLDGPSLAGRAGMSERTFHRGFAPATGETPECGWLEPELRSVNYEVVSSRNVTQSAALVAANLSGTDERSRMSVTVQFSPLSENMEAGYRQRFNSGWTISPRRPDEPWCCNAS